LVNTEEEILIQEHLVIETAFSKTTENAWLLLKLKAS
jgi:hypothetical protein